MFPILLDNDGNPKKPTEPTSTWKSCAFCHLHFPPSRLMPRVIVENGEQKEMLFCSEIHAEKYQKLVEE